MRTTCKYNTICKYSGTTRSIYIQWMLRGYCRVQNLFQPTPNFNSHPVVGGIQWREILMRRVWLRNISKPRRERDLVPCPKLQSLHHPSQHDSIICWHSHAIQFCLHADSTNYILSIMFQGFPSSTPTLTISPVLNSHHVPCKMWEGAPNRYKLVGFGNRSNPTNQHQFSCQLLIGMFSLLLYTLISRLSRQDQSSYLTKVCS